MKRILLFFTVISVIVIILLMYNFSYIGGIKSDEKIMFAKNQEFNLFTELCNGNLVAIEHWLDRGGDPNTSVASKYLVGFTPITLITSQPGCISDNTLKLVQMLLERGADVNRKGENGTPPIIAAAQGNLGRFLIDLYKKYKVEVNAIDSRGYNALMCFPLSKGHVVEDAKFWLTIGVNPSLVAPDGHSALKWVDKNQYPEAHSVILNAVKQQKKK